MRSLHGFKSAPVFLVDFSRAKIGGANKHTDTIKEPKELVKNFVPGALAAAMLHPGHHSVIITDDLGCTVSCEVNILPAQNCCTCENAPTPTCPDDVVLDCNTGQELRACKTISTPFRLVLLRANCVAKPRRSFGYAYVWRLVSAQNNFVYSVPLIILQALSLSRLSFLK